MTNLDGANYIKGSAVQHRSLEICGVSPVLCGTAVQLWANFPFALYKILHVGTGLQNQRNSVCTVPVILSDFAV